MDLKLLIIACLIVIFMAGPVSAITYEYSFPDDCDTWGAWNGTINTSIPVPKESDASCAAWCSALGGTSGSYNVGAARNTIFNANPDNANDGQSTDTYIMQSSRAGVMKICACYINPTWYYAPKTCYVGPNWTGPAPWIIPFTDFTGYPLDGYSPLFVNFTITNATAVNGSAYWNFGDGQTTDSTAAYLNHTYENPGVYTVTMIYTNWSGYENTITKTDYVLASVPSGLAVNLDIKNAITGVLVQDSTVGIQNTSSGVWRNTTAPTGLVYFTSTDPGYLYPLSKNQSITLAANKSGYQDASTTFNIPYNNYRSILYMMPTSVINSTGNGTVVVNVIRALNGLTVSGMSVALDSGQVGITNTAGAVTLFNVTAGERTASVTDPDGAYLPTEKAFVLSAGETKLVTVYVARDDDPPIDPDDPFTSPTPTPTRTYDPNDPSSPVYGNYTTSEINQQGGAGVLAMLAQLIALWPAIVVFVFLKFMRSAMS